MFLRFPLLFDSVIQIVDPVPPLFHSKPLLYEWRIYDDSGVKCIYIGKAKNGVSRPLETYPEVVRDLATNRNVNKLLSKPNRPYLKRNPWGYRWIHHQLEACADRMLKGNLANERIELRFPKFGIDLQDLHFEEEIAIAAARTMYAETSVVANGMPSMRVQYERARHLLDPVWV